MLETSGRVLPVRQRAGTMCNSHLPKTTIVWNNFFCFKADKDASIHLGIFASKWSRLNTQIKTEVCMNTVARDSEWSARFCTKRRHSHAKDLWESLAENMHVFLFDLITDQEFRLLLVGRGHSCTFPSYSKRSICPHVSAVPVFFHSDSFLMPEDFTANFPNFPLRIILAWSCQRGSECTYNKLAQSLLTKPRQKRNVCPDDGR